HRLHGLVDHFIYCDDLAGLIGCKPRLLRLFLHNPAKWWIVLTSPWNGCQFWLSDPSHHKRIFATLEQYRDNQFFEIYAFLLLGPILPLLGALSEMRIFVREKVLRKPTGLRESKSSSG